MQNNKNFKEVFTMTIMETRKMSKTEIEEELKKYTKKLEGFGMTHEESCRFVSDIMNFGIAAQEKISKK